MDGQVSLILRRGESPEPTSVEEMYTFRLAERSRLADLDTEDSFRTSQQVAFCTGFSEAWFSEKSAISG